MHIVQEIFALKIDIRIFKICKHQNLHKKNNVTPTMGSTNICTYIIVNDEHSTGVRFSPTKLTYFNMMLLIIRIYIDKHGYRNFQPSFARYILLYNVHVHQSP